MRKTENKILELAILNSKNRIIGNLDKKETLDNNNKLNYLIKKKKYNILKNKLDMMINYN